MSKLKVVVIIAIAVIIFSLKIDGHPKIVEIWEIEDLQFVQLSSEENEFSFEDTFSEGDSLLWMSRYFSDGVLHIYDDGTAVLSDMDDYIYKEHVQYESCGVYCIHFFVSYQLDDGDLTSTYYVIADFETKQITIMRYVNSDKRELSLQPYILMRGILAD